MISKSRCATHKSGHLRNSDTLASSISSIRRRSRHAVTYIETLVAVLILSLVAGAALATWTYSERVPANKRLTEMGSFIAVRELEVVKAKKYVYAPTGTTTTYYDKDGNETAVAADKVYLATTTVGTPTGVTATNTSADIREVVCVVRSADASKLFETERTLIAFGAV